MAVQDQPIAEEAFEDVARAVFSADAAGNERGYDRLTAIGVKLVAEFAQAENDRALTEQRWLQDLRQFKGQYDPEVLTRIGKNRSKAFVRKTRVKVKTIDSRCTDLLFPANSNRNWAISATPVPSITPEQKAQIVRDLTAMKNPPAPQGQPQPPTVKPIKQEIELAIKQMAEQAAKRMADVIDDQLTETKYKDVARKVIHSGNLYGTGVLKAPLVEKKVRQRFVMTAGKWGLKTESYITPFVDFVPLWRFFPDMSATDIDNCRYVYERHLMTKSALGRLADRKSFNTVKIIDYLASNPDGLYLPRYYDSELKAIGERQATPNQKNGLYDVFERWGWLDALVLKEAGVKIPTNRMHESFFSNVWFLPDGTVIKAVLQPINGVTWPYHLYYFDKDETSIFGEGVATIMRDDQDMLNAGTRMIFDNAGITAGPMLEVNMRLLAKSEKADEMYPFKIWARTGEDPASPAVRALNLDSHINELTQIVQMCEGNADETTAIPRYMTGENPMNGAAETSSGLSMLMGAAGIVIKDIISSFDEGVTKPFITALYRWNMQFNKNDAIKGDYDVAATGTSSLVAKEVRAQQLDAFAQMTANEMDAPYIKREKLLRQRAEAHDLSDVVKTEEEVAAEQNNPQAQVAAQMAQKTQEIQIAMMEGQLAKLQGEINRISAETARAEADALLKRLSGAYAAMEAAGVAISSPGVAPAGDELLRSAGWKDATPEDDTTTTLQANGGTGPANPANPSAGIQPLTPAIPERTGPNVGMNAGMETARLTDG